MAPSTLGTFTFGHVRQLDRLTEQLPASVGSWAGPGDGPMTDLDSTVCQVHGDHKQGAAYGYLGNSATTRCWPRDTGEVLHARQRTGRANTARGRQLRRRTGRASAPRWGDRGADHTDGLEFWSAKTIKTCRRHRIRYSITVRQTKPIRAAIAAIDEDDWTRSSIPTVASRRSPRPATGLTG